MPPAASGRLRLAVIGTGISGLSAAWLLNSRHDVTVFEAASRAGGHSNTVVLGDGDRPVAVDTGFIVYNERNYRNLVELFRTLGVATRPTTMSFAVSLDGGRFEYGGGDLGSLLAQPANLLRGRFWSMLRDLRRFYRLAVADLPALDRSLIPLGEYLDRNGYRRPFVEDHLLPMAAAIWSAPPSTLRRYPAAAFIRFCDNHGLLQLSGRPQWRSVVGGSRSYVDRIVATLARPPLLGRPVTRVRRSGNDVSVEDAAGAVHDFDQVVVATHADEALRLLADPTEFERRWLSPFRYERNIAALHGDARLMPRRRRAWSSWNYLQEGADRPSSFTYWMNLLQGLQTAEPIFVTLNPPRPPEKLHREETYTHPIFDAAALVAQRSLWSLQGVNRTWFCGAYFGSGFHEDGLQAGLAVAEQLGDVARPWSLPAPSSRIHVERVPAAALAA